MTSTPQWSEASIIDAIQRWAERHGRPPRREDWKHAAVGRPRAWTVRYHIGWSEALLRAGFAPHHRTDRWSDAAIIAAIRRWADEHDGVPPTPSDWQRGGDGQPNAGTVYNRIGWNTAILRAGLTPRGRRPKWSDAAIIAAIQRWADRHDGVPPTFADRVQGTDEHPAGWTVYNRIGWSEALSRAGFPTIARPNWSETEILGAIRRWAARNGGVAPTSLDWHRSGPDHPSAVTVSRRIGWKEAVHRAG